MPGVCDKLKTYHANIFVQKMSAGFTSAAYSTNFITEANTMNPDQNVPQEAVWSGSIKFAI